MKKFQFFALAAVAFLFASCGEKVNPNEEAGYPSHELTASNSLVITTIEHDPTAAYPVSVEIKLDGENLAVIGRETNPTDQILSQFPIPSTTVCANSAVIANVGRASKIDKIDEYPEETEYAATQTCEEGHGYVIKAQGAANLSSYNRAGLADPKPLYIRLIIDEALETGGYTMYYQLPFYVTE